MSDVNDKHFLTQQVKKYQGHYNTVKRTKATLQHQYRIQTTETLPKKHHPKPPVVVDTVQNKEFTKSFNKKYRRFFSECLQEAITKNTITLELEKARCQDVIRQTEEFLCQITESSTNIKTYYTEFLQTIEATNHQMSPQLKHKLQNTKDEPPSTVSIYNPAIQQPSPSEHVTTHQTSSSEISTIFQPSPPESTTSHQLSPPEKSKIQHPTLSESTAIIQPLSSEIPPTHQSSSSGNQIICQQPTKQIGERRNLSKPPGKKWPKLDHVSGQRPQSTKQPYKPLKRKGTHTQPPTRKQLKIDHFLVKRQKLSHDPP